MFIIQIVQKVRFFALTLALIKRTINNINYLVPAFTFSFRIIIDDLAEEIFFSL